MPRFLKIILVMCPIVVMGFIFLLTLRNPFDFGPCDGYGLPNRQETLYYDNGKIEYYGTVKNCVWEGEVKHFYRTGELEHIKIFQEGIRNGLAKYYTNDGKEYRIENFDNGVINNFSITDLLDSCTFQFSDKKLIVKNKNYIKQITFDKSTTLYGPDEPLTSIKNRQLLIRGKEDFYAIDTKLNVKLNLRDTLMKYIPSAYTERIDASVNKYTFLWHRQFLGDTLRVKVFYDADDHQSVSKIWERSYVLR